MPTLSLSGHKVRYADEAHSHAAGGHTHSHDTDLTGVSADDHHAETHGHASHTGIGAADHHGAFVQTDHDVLPNPHHSNANDHAASHTHASHTGIGATDHHSNANDHVRAHDPIATADHSPFPGGTANFLRADGTWNPPPGGGTANLLWPLHADGSANLTLTNQANSEQFLGNSNRNIVKLDLTNYADVRLRIRVAVGSASVNNPRVYLEYRATTFSTTIGDYLAIGASAVNVSLTTAGWVETAWIALVAGAKADVWIALLQNGGDAAADPALGCAYVEFRA